MTLAERLVDVLKRSGAMTEIEIGIALAIPDNEVWTVAGPMIRRGEIFKHDEVYWLAEGRDQRVNHYQSPEWAEYQAKAEGRPVEYRQDAGCDRCGTNDRAPNSYLCAECLAEGRDQA